MFNIITKIFGTRSHRALKALQPYVTKINAEVDQLSELSHEALREKSNALREYIKEALHDFQKQIENKKQHANSLQMSTHDKEVLFAEIDKLEEQSNKRLEEVLEEILPQAFAIVKETARRFTENAEVKVRAQDYDQVLAQNKDHVSIQGDTAVWKNSWEVAGNMITWDMIHYDVQLIGGVILHQGKIAEMATGEGKTLVATLPAFLNALTGKGVHVVTVNDYLARRDSEWKAPIFEFHGLTVDCIDKYPAHSQERRNAYRADITYGTNNEFGFDYLRDNMAEEVEEIVQRKHHFAMIDEVDSVLIDDARTPLIISGPAARDDEQEYYHLKPRVVALYEAQKKLVGQYLQSAKKLIAEKDNDEGGLALFRAHRGLPKYKPLIKYLSEIGVKQVLQKTENYFLQDNSRLMPEADEPLFFTIDEQNNNIELTDKGIEFLTKEGEDPQFFVLPDVGSAIARIENDETLSNEDKITQTETLTQDYGVKAQRIHIVNQLLRAYALFEVDVEYIVVDNQVKIVDEQTGRVLDGRRYSDGLHQAIEAKENVKVERASQTYATVTLQNYFRMYHKLSGMTGTAETEAHEFWEIYKLDVVVAPTNKPIIRDDRDDKVYKTMREKFNAVIDEIVLLTSQKRPVLVGTTSVEVSELISRMLSMRKVKHQVLNAKQHQREAEVVAEAGKAGTVTIATNMAGRGTDIKLTPEARAAGGLAIIGTERHESRRVDRQLRGRSGRQGDVGSSQFFISLEDDLMRLFGSDRIARIMDRMGLEEGEVIQHSMITKSIERAQKKVEGNNFAHRKRLLEYDDVMNMQREVIYKRRRHALWGERLEIDIMNMLKDTAEDIVANAKTTQNYEAFKLDMLGTLGIITQISPEELAQKKTKQLIDQVYEEASSAYGTRKSSLKETTLPIMQEIDRVQKGALENIAVPFSDGKEQTEVVVNLQDCLSSQGETLVRGMERAIILSCIDRYWKVHLQAMDDLRQSVQNAVYEQKDPLLIYKFESFELFKSFIHKVNRETMAYLLKEAILVHQASDVRAATAHSQRHRELHEGREDVLGTFGAGAEMEDELPVTEPIKASTMPGRNERVTVRYNDGTLKEGVKFKNVEEDLNNSLCILVEDDQ